MLKRIVLSLSLLSTAALAPAATGHPVIDAWQLNCSGATGYLGLEADVQAVQYNSTAVYINSSGIPSYTIGPFDAIKPSDQNYSFKITRTPQRNAGALIETPNGVIGVWLNGVPIFNAKDAMTYNNLNIWHQNAAVVEAMTFDACGGHGAPGMGPGGQTQARYHHHQNPVCLYDDNPGAHSPLLGFSFDGYPVYGPRGFENTNGTGSIVRMTSGYRLRSITVRQALPDGTTLTPAQFGPAVSGQFPLGYYIEDFEYVTGLGNLDANNGRTCVTPEYPGGTYAYFVTIDSSGESAYPYTFGPDYYGMVDSSLFGPNGEHVSIPAGTTPRTCAAEPTPSPSPTPSPTPMPTATPAPTATPGPTPTPTPCGDFNGDGAVDAADLLHKLLGRP